MTKQLEGSNERMQKIEESISRNRDQLHDLQEIVKSLPTKSDVSEDLETHRKRSTLIMSRALTILSSSNPLTVSTALQEQTSILFDRLLPAINHGVATTGQDPSTQVSQQDTSRR